MVLIIIFNIKADLTYIKDLTLKSSDHNRDTYMVSPG